MKLIVLKLVNGEEVIGEIQNESFDDGIVTISDALGVENKLDDSTGMAFSVFYPWMIYSIDKLFTFSLKHVITYTYPDMIMTNYYLSFRDKQKELLSKDRTIN